MISLPSPVCNVTGGGSNGAFLDPAIVGTNKNDCTFYLGGVTLYAEGSSLTTFDSGNIWLTGENGDPVFYLDGANMGITDTAGSVAGPGGFTVYGAAGRTFTAKGTYLNEGTIRATGGATLAFSKATINGPTNLVVEANSKVEMYLVGGENPCVVEKDFEAIDLADESCLTLWGQALTVKRLTVGGHDRAPGLYTFHSGTVRVLGDGHGLLLIFN